MAVVSRHKSAPGSADARPESGPEANRARAFHRLDRPATWRRVARPRTGSPTAMLAVAFPTWNGRIRHRRCQGPSRFQNLQCSFSTRSGKPPTPDPVWKATAYAAAVAAHVNVFVVRSEVQCALAQPRTPDV